MEEKIIDLLKKKEFSGLELLIDFLGDDIVKTIHAVLSRPEELSYRKDAENEVFYKLWKKIAGFDRTKSSFKTWVLTITKNTCIDKKRMIMRQNKIPFDESIEFITHDSYFEKEEFLALIHCLNEEDQQIFLKHYYYQLSPQAIAEELNLKPAQIYNRLSRGRQKLKTALSKEEEHHHG